MTMAHWQPTLAGTLVHLRPLTEADFEPLFLAASDPKIWELHPDPLRCTRQGFEAFFRSGLASHGALAVLDQRTGRLIGSSRFTDHDAASSSVEIGYTFLAREYWGGKYNGELKQLMLRHAFARVETVYFVVGMNNFRSRAAVEKLTGAELVDGKTTPVTGDISTSVVYRIRKASWMEPHPRQPVP